MNANVMTDIWYVWFSGDTSDFFLHSDDEDASAGCIVNELIRQAGGFED